MSTSTETPKLIVARSYEPLWQEHRENYLDGDCCDLCPRSLHKCLVRGRIPADVLYVGEGPGESEDVQGFPFTGPAGQLLDRMIGDATVTSGDDANAAGDMDACPEAFTHAFTNLIACIPLDDDKKIRQPNKKEIVSCQPRLLDIIHIVQPRLVVLSGLLSQKHFPRHLVQCPNRIEQYVEIVHPSAILRSQEEDERAAALAYKRTVIALAAAYRKLL